MYQKRYVKKSFATSGLNELANERSTLEAKKKVLNAKVDLKMFFFSLAELPDLTSSKTLSQFR